MFLLGLFFLPESGDIIFLQNVGESYHTTLYYICILKCNDKNNRSLGIKHSLPASLHHIVMNAFWGIYLKPLYPGQEFGLNPSVIELVIQL